MVARKFGSIKRVASAAVEGATAVQLIHQYLGQDLLRRPKRARRPGGSRLRRSES